MGVYWPLYIIREGLVILLLLVGSTYSFAQNEDTAMVSVEEAQAAQDAANAWLSFIDDMDYTSSWQQAAPVLQERESESAWEQTLESDHGPLGPLLSRAPQNREYTRSAPDLPEGEYVVMVYESSYTQLEDAIETVIMTRTADDSWRAAGYEIRPAP